MHKLALFSRVFQTLIGWFSVLTPKETKNVFWWAHLMFQSIKWSFCNKIKRSIAKLVCFMENYETILNLEILVKFTWNTYIFFLTTLPMKITSYFLFFNKFQNISFVRIPKNMYLPWKLDTKYIIYCWFECPPFFFLIWSEKQKHADLGKMLKNYVFCIWFWGICTRYANIYISAKMGGMIFTQ